MFKPMLAATVEDVTKLRFPLFASPKLDGIRCLIVDGEPVSRTLKPIPNKAIHKLIKGVCGNYKLDGELMIPGYSFNELQSIVMSHDKPIPDVGIEYHVFDLVMDKPFIERLVVLDDLLEYNFPFNIKLVRQHYVTQLDKLIEFEAECVSEGYEGVMLRSKDSPYKHGRSTFKEHYLMKLKRFHDAEAIVVDVEELMHNTNEKEKDNLGHSKRSSKLAGKVPADTLGAFVVQMPDSGLVFKIGTGLGLDAGLRKQLWDSKDCVGKTITYTYQELSRDGIPRFPVWKGFRHD